MGKRPVGPQEPDESWVLVALWHRITYGQGKVQYDMCLTVDLTDMIPLVKEKVAGTGAASRCTGGSTIRGVYHPDEQIWTFAVNGRQIKVPELLEDSYGGGWEWNEFEWRDNYLEGWEEGSGGILGVTERRSVHRIKLLPVPKRSFAFASCLHCSFNTTKET